MIRLFVNSLAASAGGGLTYIRNVLPVLSARSDVQVSVAMSPEIRQEFRALQNINFVEVRLPLARRFWHEQVELPGIIRDCRADVLISTGNFALRKSPVPQVLLSRNSIYTCVDYYRDLRERHEYRAWLDTRLRGVIAKKSIHWADVTIAPSEAFAGALRRWTDRQVLAIHHGFDHFAFTRDQHPLPENVEAKLRTTDGSLKLLFVSHFNYYRNFETLIRALPLLRKGAAGRPIKLLLTCQVSGEQIAGFYHPQSIAELIEKLGVSDMVVELGSIPYRQLHQIYRRADFYVTPAYTETFAHPLVEAMASGVPVVASDLAVHREICGDAADYFPRFSFEKLSEIIGQLAISPEKVRCMIAGGRQRARRFSWNTHVDKILRVCAALLHSGFTTDGFEIQGYMSENDGGLST